MSIRFYTTFSQTKSAKAPSEQINKKNCKYILGVSSRASYFAVKAELGREPIFAFICSQVIRCGIRKY